IALNGAIVDVLRQTFAKPSAGNPSDPGTTQATAPIELADDGARVPDPNSSNLEDDWKRWWYNQLGYRYDAPAQVSVAVNASPQLPGPTVMSCFAGGTPVRT